LVLAIYGAMQTGDVMKLESNTEAGKSISILTDPLQAGFAEGSFGTISFRDNTRINNFCYDGGVGKNDISVSTRSNIGTEWNSPGEPSSIYNKYIFSEDRLEGSDYYVFSKSFDFPYKVADLIFLMSESYCFLNAPNEVEDEIVGLGIKNIEVGECEDIGAERVCFGGGSDCDVIVYGSCSSNCESIYDSGKVVKGSEEMSYVGSLMYGAIFSSEDIYNCNVERLMFRTSKVAKVFSEKVDLMGARGCDSNLKGDLVSWSGMTGNSSSDGLASLRSAGNSLDRKNSREICGVW